MERKPFDNAQWQKSFILQSQGWSQTQKQQSALLCELTSPGSFLPFSSMSESRSMQCPQVEETVMESKPHSALGWPCSTLLFIWITTSDLSAYLLGREGIKHRLGN